MEKMKVGQLEIYDKDNYYNHGLSVLLDYKANLCDWGIGVKTPKNIFEVLEHWKINNGNYKKVHTEKLYKVLLELCNEEVEWWEEEDEDE